jgi:Tfp pilus assembly protein PilO
MQSLAQQSGVTLSGGVGQDGSAAAVLDSQISQPVEIPLSLSVSGNYDQVVKYVQNIEASIRQINVTAITVSGTNEGIKASLTAVTYYQPARSLDVSKSEVK